MSSNTIDLDPTELRSAPAELAPAGAHVPAGLDGPASRQPGETPRWYTRRWWVWALGLSGLVGVGFTVWLGLWVTPPDVNMGQLVRLVYVHPPIAWVCYLAFGVATLASMLYLWPRTRSRFWDRLAGASAEIGVVFGILTMATGSIWGRPTWGVWWTWDARLTSTALLIVLYIGYLALRRIPSELHVRSRRAAIAAIIAFADIPVDHFSVLWWHTLHQGPTVLTATLVPKITGIMAWTMLLGFVAFTLVYCWMLVVRYRLETVNERLETEGMGLVLVERRAEGIEELQGNPVYAMTGVPGEDAGAQGPGSALPPALAGSEPES